MNLSIEIEGDEFFGKVEEEVPKVLKKEVQGGLISDLFDQKILTYLESVFAETGDNSLSCQEFRDLISEYIPSYLVDNICKAIDVNDGGYINYSDFTNYLIASEAGSSISTKSYSTRLVFYIQQNEDSSANHKDFIDNLVYVRKPCPMIVSGGRDGQISLWDPKTLAPFAQISHRDKNSVFREELSKDMGTSLRAYVNKHSMERARKADESTAITSMCPLLHSGLLCVGSADCCMTIYDLGTQEVCGRFSKVEYIPTAIECFSCRQNYYYNPESSHTQLHIDSTLPQQFIAIGDSKGLLYLIRLHPEFGVSTEVGTKKKNQLLFAQSAKENCATMRIAQDWIAEMRFIVEVDSLVVGSVDGLVSFVDATKMIVTKQFHGHMGSKSGVKTLSWSAFGKYIVSGGDRLLLFWDPFTLEAAMKMDTLPSPIVKVEVHDACNKVFGVLTNKCIFMWHNITFEPLQSIADPTHYKPIDALTAVVFSDDSNSLYTAGNRITMWNLERALEESAQKDEQDLVVVLYNPLFHQVVMVKSLGLVKVYQSETGEVVRQFPVVPIDPHSGKPVALRVDPSTGLHEPIIRAACFDKHQTRLIVTAQNMSVQFWNINDGTNMLQLQPQLYSTSLASQYAHLHKSITSVMHEIVEVPEKKSAKKLLFMGTELGNICVYQEISSVIDEVPTLFLRLHDHTVTVRDTKKPAHEPHAPAAKARPKLTQFVHNLITANRFLNTSKNGSHESLSSEQVAAEASSIMLAAKSQQSEEKVDLSSLEHAVLWVRHVPDTSLILVSYLNGQVALWDVEHNLRLPDLPLQQTGPVLVGMRVKGENSAQAEPQAAASTSPVKPLAVEAEGNAKEDGNDGAAQEELVPEARSPINHAEDRINANKKYRKHTQAVVGHRTRKSTLLRLPESTSIVPTPPSMPAPSKAVAAVGETRPERSASENARQAGDDESVRTTGSMHSYESEFQRQRNISADLSVDSVNDGTAVSMHSTVLPTAQANLQSKRRDSAAAVVFQGQQGKKLSITPKLSISLKSNSFLLARLPSNTLQMMDDSATLSSGETRDQRLKPSQMIRKLSGAEQGSDLQQQSISAEGSIDSLATSDILSSTVTGTTDMESESKVQEEEEKPPPPPPPKIVVDCMVVLPDAQVIVGACSDRYLRFWDLNTHHVLCSCVYYHQPEEPSKHAKHHHPWEPKPSAPVAPTAPAAPENVPVDEVLRLLSVSDTEDLLIGGYDNGMMRLWAVQSYSIVTLRTLLNKHINSVAANLSTQARLESFEASVSTGFGLAISPINLIKEWQAHASPVMSVEYLWFDYEMEQQDDSDDSEEDPPHTAQSARLSVATPSSAPQSRPTTRPSPPATPQAITPFSPMMNPRKTLAAAPKKEASPKSKLRKIVQGTRKKREKQSDMGQEILEGYIVTAGLDQRVFLWTVKGVCVGEFGTFGWDINSESTWFKGALLGDSSKPAVMRRAYGMRTRGKNAKSGSFGNMFQQKSHSLAETASTRFKTSAAAITKDFMALSDSPSTIMLQTLGRKPNPTIQEIYLYSDLLTKHVTNREPASATVSKHLNIIMAKYPMVPVKERKRSSPKARSVVT